MVSDNSDESYRHHGWYGFETTGVATPIWMEYKGFLYGEPKVFVSNNRGDDCYDSFCVYLNDMRIVGDVFLSESVFDDAIKFIENNREFLIRIHYEDSDKYSFFDEELIKNDVR